MLKVEVAMSERELENRIEQLEARLTEMQQGENSNQSTDDELSLDEKLDLISYIAAENGKDTAFIKWAVIGVFAVWIARAGLAYFSLI